jgi:hypothetical protein
MTNLTQIVQLELKKKVIVISLCMLKQRKKKSYCDLFMHAEAKKKAVAHRR